MNDTYTADQIAAMIADGETTIAQAAEITDWPIIDGVLVPEPMEWYADAGDCTAQMECICDSGEEAAQEYVNEGSPSDWGVDDRTTWVNVWAWRKGIDEEGDIVEVERQRHKIRIDPVEPDCKDAGTHDWQSPYEIVGGIKENPGVWGSGGSVSIQEVCMRCGYGKVTDHWAQHPYDGTQGLTSVRYVEDKYTRAVKQAQEIAEETMDDEDA